VPARRAAGLSAPLRMMNASPGVNDEPTPDEQGGAIAAHTVAARPNRSPWPSFSMRSRAVCPAGCLGNS
jgi:hypothetical protein